jgi:H+/gluconate symporter-like permease
VRPLLLTLLVLVVVSISMTIVCGGYGVANFGTMFPGPDDTPAQQAAGKYHSGVTQWLLLGAVLSWLATVVAGVTAGIMWVAKRKRTRREDSR